MAEHLDPLSLPAEADSPPDGASARIQAARRARRRSRSRQAVAARRGSASTWLDTLGRVWIGLVLLALLAGVTWIEISLAQQRAEQAAQLAEEQAAAESARVEAATFAAAREAAWEAARSRGPEVSIGLIEANGPILGCTSPSQLGDLQARLGAALVGECVEQPWTDDATGATRQRTTKGELVWQGSDDRVAFTDGVHSWIAGPDGMVRRGNDERFAWERDADDGPRPARATHVPPPTLPGAILPARRIVSYYGNPLASGMGVLGEMPPEQLFPRLKAQANEYRVADATRAVTPALELVAVVAQAQPGLDGLYRLRMDPELIERVAGWAEQQGFLLILDVQIGRGRVDDEVQWLLPFLKRPNVHLALDPEFAMPANHVPGQRIGTMDAAPINGAQRVLADLVEAHGLPPKLLVVHRFTEEMVTSPQRITMDPRVQVVMVMDGFGSPPLKSRQYNELIAEPRVQYTGFKLFYRHDEPLMTPAQVLLLDPAPDLVIYQ